MVSRRCKPFTFFIFATKNFQRGNKEISVGYRFQWRRGQGRGPLRCASGTEEIWHQTRCDVRHQRGRSRGGAFRNLPVSAIRQKCDKVIALNLYHLEEEKYKNNLVSVAYRAFLMMMVSNVAADAAQADLFVELDTCGCMAHDISKIEELFFRGYESTVKVLEENGCQRVMPKETIEFPKKKGKKNIVSNPEEVFRNTIEKGMSAINAIRGKK